MTRVINLPDGNRIVILEEENEQQCDDCGEIDELRPYGPNGTMICFNCMLKDEKGAKERMMKQLYGE